MRVLLAGASGAIGRHLVPQLTAAGHEVIGITRRRGSVASLDVAEVVADILDRSALLQALDGVRADAVIHQVTALAKPPAAVRDMRQTNRLRVEGTSALIAAARAVGARKFVAASFFGGYGLSDHGREPLTESAPFGEVDSQVASVQTALLSLEQQVRAYGGVCLRYGLFYDSTSKDISPVSRTWDGVLPMLHLSDAASAVVRVLARYRAGSVYNIADEQSMSYRSREIARAQAAHLRPPRQLPDSALRLAAPFGALLLTRTSMSLDTGKATEELKWKPQYPSLLECLGVGAPVAREVLFSANEPDDEADDEFDFSSVLTSAPVPEPEPEPEPEPAPEPEPEPEPEPALMLAAEAVEPAAQPATDPEPAPKPRAVKHPKSPPKLGRSQALLKDTDDAIARIGVWNDDL